jgi:glycosyltransferase involved in cell wall biosynthesis
VKNSNKSVAYFARIVKNKSLGIEKKIRQTTNTLNSLGYPTECNIFDYHGLKNISGFCIAIINSKADILFIRNSSITPLLFPFLLYKKINGIKIIIDIPTPNCVVADEINLKDAGYIGKKIRLLALYLSFPWSLIPTNLILQYAHESNYFSFLLKNKIKLIANGIDVESIKPKSALSRQKNDQITLIAVAALGHWHGFDRLVNSIYDFTKDNEETLAPKISFIIVGDGEGLSEYKKLVTKFNLEEVVQMVGYKDNQELDALYELADIAVSTIGLFRKKLDMASSLKSREYTARGIPFIMAGYDLDFDPIPDFVHCVSNSDEKIDFQAILNWFQRISQDHNLNKKIRDYAVKNLDFQIKLKNIFNDERVN